MLRRTIRLGTICYKPKVMPPPVIITSVIPENESEAEKESKEVEEKNDFPSEFPDEYILYSHLHYLWK